MLLSHCFQPTCVSEAAAEGLTGSWGKARTELLVLALLHSAGSLLHVKNFVGSSFFSSSDAVTFLGHVSPLESTLLLSCLWSTTSYYHVCP